MKKISITEALCELKLYDSKINKAVGRAEFVTAAKKSSDLAGVVQKEDFKKKAQASYQSIMDLIANRNALKSAIVHSNAVTEVVIHHKTMTVAEAIERKNSIQYEEKLLKKMEDQYAAASVTFELENKKVDEKINGLIAVLIGKESDQKISSEDQNAIEKPYREKNEFEFMDPIGVRGKMEALADEIDGFKSEVDTKLSISNSTTYIEVDF